jgi:hypothetical protein
MFIQSIVIQFVNLLQLRKVGFSFLAVVLSTVFFGCHKSGSVTGSSVTALDAGAVTADGVPVALDNGSPVATYGGASGFGMNLDGDVVSYGLTASSDNSTAAGNPTDNSTAGVGQPTLTWNLQTSSSGNPGTFTTVEQEPLTEDQSFDLGELKKVCRNRGLNKIHFTHFGPSIVKSSDDNGEDDDDQGEHGRCFRSADDNRYVVFFTQENGQFKLHVKKYSCAK